MDRCLLLLNGWPPAPRALDAVDKYMAARDWSGAPATGSAWLTPLLLLIAIILFAALIALLLYRRAAETKAFRQVLEARARQVGLTDPELYVLLAIAKAAKVRNATALLSSAEAFDRGANRLLTSRRVTSLSAERRDGISVLIESMRGRLAVGRPAPAVNGAAPETASPLAPSLNEGDRLAVIYRGRSATFDVHVAATADEELVVEPSTPMACKPGESWLLQYAEGGSLWEFDAPVVRSEEGKITLGRMGRPRFINRRRFPRVPTSKLAHLATFPMWRQDSQVGKHEFVTGELIEIAGTGLKLRAPIEARAGQRILLTLDLAPNRVIEGLGKVRRVRPTEDGQADLVVELLGLNEEEVARLTQETNAAAHANAAARVAGEPADEAKGKGEGE